MSLIPSVENILAVYNGRRDWHYREGMAWYDERHALACTLDPANPSQAAAVIAVLSPNTPWSRNEKLARQGYADGYLGSVTFGNNVAKANRILSGEPAENVVRGPKVTAFWQAIADPTNPSALVPIDRHAFDIAVGQRCDDKSRGMGKKRYMQFVNCYRDAATYQGVGVSQLQAVTWLVWRDAIGVTNG